jgi:DNA-binding SARP family transcriptional activator
LISQVTANRRSKLAQPSFPPAGSIGLSLLDGFELDVDGWPVPLPMSGQRVLAFLALHDRWLPRPFVSGALWPDHTEGRAAGNLRSALWRLSATGHRLVETLTGQLLLSRVVRVDVREVSKIASMVGTESRNHGLLTSIQRATIVGELLPGWYEDWVLLERERFRQIRLHLLEALCEELIEAGRYAQAIEAGYAAVSGEPLRESAHRVLIRAHIAEGNTSEAIREYARFREVLRRELNLEPSPQMQQLVASISPGFTS